LEINNDFVSDILVSGGIAELHDVPNDIEKLLRQNFGTVIVNQLKNLKMRNAAIEAVKTFDVELVQDYLEITGQPWLDTQTGEVMSSVPTENVIRHFLAHEVRKVISERKIVECHTDNSFIIFYDGDHITIVYSIAKITCGNIIEKE